MIYTTHDEEGIEVSDLAFTGTDARQMVIEDSPIPADQIEAMDEVVRRAGMSWERIAFDARQMAYEVGGDPADERVRQFMAAFIGGLLYGAAAVLEARGEAL